MNAPGAVITGWGYYVPERVLTNADLERMVGTTDEWIVERTGIRERRIVADGETTSSMATAAARQALERAGIAGGDLDAIIVGTTTPDYLLPTAAALVQEHLGSTRAAIFDLGAACAGFIYGLAVARGLIAAGTAERVLIGAETISRYVDWTDRSTCVLFGDGAGAVIVEASTRSQGIASTVLHGDGSKRAHLTVLGGGSKHPPTEASVRDGLHYIRMDGNEVFKLAVPSMASAAEEALALAGLRGEDVDLLVPHQANLRIIDAVAKRLRLERSKVFVNIEKYGNTSAASIPIALCEAVAAGRVRQGRPPRLRGVRRRHDLGSGGGGVDRGEGAAMKIDELRRVCVVGAGLMGRQIALNTAHHGYEVELWDADPKQLAAARAWVAEYVAGRIEKGRWRTDEADIARSRLAFAEDLAEAAHEADLAIEAVVEDLDVKRAVFADLDRLCPLRAVLATNSSTFVSSLVADATKRPAQVANLHYFNPALVMELVEVVQGPHTAPETVELLLEFARRTGKRPILIQKEIEGFIANRLLWAVSREACALLDGGYATFEEIDLAAEKALGYPMGPFRLMDLTGIDLAYLIRTARHRATGRDEDRPPRCIEERYRAGHYGRKTGRGFYTY